MTAEIQAAQLAMSFVLGVALGLFYDVYRVWFRAAGRRWQKSLGDILWWLAALLAAAWAMYRINGLSLRGFPLVMALLGCVVEQWLISPQFFPLMSRLFGGIAAVGRRLFRIMRRLVELVLTPLVLPIELGFRLLLFIKRLLSAALSVVFGAVRWLTSPLWKPLLRMLQGGQRAARRWFAGLRAAKSTNSPSDNLSDNSEDEEMPSIE